MHCGLANVKQLHRDPKQYANVSATAADVETTLTLPASPRLILLGGTGQVTTGRRWMITLEGRVISEGITPTFLTGLAAVFAIYYVFNLQYQEEVSCTLEFIQRRFIGINPERGTKAIRGKVVSKKTAVIVQKKSATRGAGTFTGRAGRTEKVKLRGGRANGKQGSGRIDEEATVRRGSTVEALLHGDLLYGCKTLIDGSVEGIPDYCNALKFLSFAPLACSYQGQCASESDTLRTIGRRTPSLQLLSADQIPGSLGIETRCA
ncbi:hypothetical protein NQZ68_036384 [Dissostichus eleginoides]|nr:hypothetical protein NQZ68_036384 [Dissostichus eleginoides]